MIEELVFQGTSSSQAVDPAVQQFHLVEHTRKTVVAKVLIPRVRTTEEIEEA